MMYVTTNLTVYSPKNRACAELNEWIAQYEHVLFKDELSFDAFKEEVRHKVQEVNTKYPKIKKKLAMSDVHRQLRVKAMVNGLPDEVFILNYARIRSVYEFSESLPEAHHLLEAKKGDSL